MRKHSSFSLRRIDMHQRRLIHVIRLLQERLNVRFHLVGRTRFENRRREGALCSRPLSFSSRSRSHWSGSSDASFARRAAPFFCINESLPGSQCPDRVATKATPAHTFSSALACVWLCASLSSCARLRIDHHPSLSQLNCFEIDSDRVRVAAYQPCTSTA